VTLRRVLVTGATGFVGANLVRRLVADGHVVHATGRAGRDRWRLAGLDDLIHFHEGDLSVAADARSIVDRAEPEWVFHLAAYGAYPTQNDLFAAVQTNVVGTVNLALACMHSRLHAFINAGSSSEYGLKDHAPSEAEWLDPNSHYAASKASATVLCRQIASTHRAPLVTLRLYSAYGPYEEPSRLIPAIVLEGLRGRLPPLAGPETARDFIHIDDVVAALVTAAEQGAANGGAVFNLGTGLQTTLRDVVNVARRSMAIEMEPQWDSMPARRWDTTVWVSDNQFIRDRLGWRPQRDFEDGLTQTIDWFRRHDRLRELYERRRSTG